MKILVALGTAVAVPFVAVFVLLTVAICVATGAEPSASASPVATADIPVGLVDVYRDAAASCPLPWSVLAAIGKVESDHGRSTLPGVASGTANSAGAMGPMQFLGSTWSVYGVDSDGDGRADVYDLTDAVWGAARFLCANGAGNAATLRSAIWTYNHSATYVDDVLRIAGSYAQPADAQHRLPLDRSIFASHPEYLSAPHHDYPAIDIPTPVGSPVYAVTAGTVSGSATEDGKCGGTIVIDGDDGARYTYCHLSQELLDTGERVTSGQIIALSGGRPGTTGAGDAIGSHLHLGVLVNGRSVCPQALLAAWFESAVADLDGAPTTGCTF